MEYKRPTREYISNECLLVPRDIDVGVARKAIARRRIPRFRTRSSSYPYPRMPLRSCPCLWRKTKTSTTLFAFLSPFVFGLKFKRNLHCRRKAFYIVSRCYLSIAALNMKSSFQVECGTSFTRRASLDFKPLTFNCRPRSSSCFIYSNVTVNKETYIFQSEKEISIGMSRSRVVQLSFPRTRTLFLLYRCSFRVRILYHSKTIIISGNLMISPTASTGFCA